MAIKKRLIMAINKKLKQWQQIIWLISVINNCNNKFGGKVTNKKPYQNEFNTFIFHFPSIIVIFLKESKFKKKIFVYEPWKNIQEMKPNLTLKQP